MDYQEFMRRLQNPIVTFDKVRRQWWIGDTSTCFIYNGTGLSEASVTPTFLSNFNGQLLGAFQEHGTDEARVTVSEVSLNSRAIKTLMAVETDLRTDGIAYGGTRYRYDYTKPLQDSPMKRIDPRGFFFPVVAGSELEVRIITPNFRNTHLSKLWLRYKTTDRTAQRGVINAGAPQESGANS